ncbi:hypothetical protein N9B29_01915 [bacterium]|nr:hypothetical protein [bacterium]
MRRHFYSGSNSSVPSTRPDANSGGTNRSGMIAGSKKRDELKLVAL